jgi:hypothetical protein
MKRKKERTKKASTEERICILQNLSAKSNIRALGKHQILYITKTLQM